MKFPAPVKVQWLASLINADHLIGNTEGDVEGVNEIHRVEPGDVVFVDHPKYYQTCIQSAATCIIINSKEEEAPQGKTLLVTDVPFDAYLKIVNHFKPYQPIRSAIGNNTVVSDTAVISHGAVLGNNVKIGNHSIIHPNVTILDDVIIGDYVVVQSGSVIGSDAFYYNTKKNRDVWYNKMASCGRVIIEDFAEIGASCTIDKGVTHDTIVGKGTKLDNMVHIGHDTVIGKNCLIAAQVGIAGGVTVGNGVVIWGQVGVSKTLTIEDNVVILGQSGIMHTLKEGKTYFGSPAVEAMERKREILWAKRIPELWKKLK